MKKVARVGDETPVEDKKHISVPRLMFIDDMLYDSTDRPYEFHIATLREEYKVDALEKVEEAWRRISSQRYGAIILTDLFSAIHDNFFSRDPSIVRESGLRTCNAVELALRISRGYGINKDTPIIHIGCLHDSSIAEYLKRHGVTHNPLYAHLEKCATTSQLIEIVQKSLRASFIGSEPT